MTLKICPVIPLVKKLWLLPFLGQASILSAKANSLPNKEEKAQTYSCQQTTEDTIEKNKKIVEVLLEITPKLLPKIVEISMSKDKKLEISTNKNVFRMLQILEINNPKNDFVKGIVKVHKDLDKLGIAKRHVTLLSVEKDRNISFVTYLQDDTFQNLEDALVANIIETAYIIELNQIIEKEGLDKEISIDFLDLEIAANENAIKALEKLVSGDDETSLEFTDKHKQAYKIIRLKTIPQLKRDLVKMKEL